MPIPFDIEWPYLARQFIWLFGCQLYLHLWGWDQILPSLTLDPSIVYCILFDSELPNLVYRYSVGWKNLQGLTVPTNLRGRAQQLKILLPSMSTYAIWHSMTKFGMITHERDWKASVGSNVHLPPVIGHQWVGVFACVMDAHTIWWRTSS